MDFEQNFGAPNAEQKQDVPPITQEEFDALEAEIRGEARPEDLVLAKEIYDGKMTPDEVTKAGNNMSLDRGLGVMTKLVEKITGVKASAWILGAGILAGSFAGPLQQGETLSKADYVKAHQIVQMNKSLGLNDALSFKDLKRAGLTDRQSSFMITGNADKAADFNKGSASASETIVASGE